MIRFGFSLLLLFIPFDLLAQVFIPSPDWQFENFNSQNHFINREILNLAVDGYGYVWTCNKGVQRFDGYRTVEFNHFDQSKGTLRDDNTDIIADKNGRIWVSSGGLCYYDDASGKFIYVQPESKHPITYVLAFCAQKNFLWFVCDYGLAKLDLRSLKLSFTALTNVNDALCTSLIDENTLFVSSREKVYIYNIKKNSYSSNTLIYKHSLVKVFTVNRSDKDIFLGTNRGLFTIKNLKDISFVSKASKDISVNDLLFLPQDKEKKYLFLATEGKGIMVYNTILKKIEFTYVHDDNNPYSLPNNIILRLVADKRGKIWVSSAFGISLLDVFNQQWRMRYLIKSDKDALSINKISGDKYNSSKVWMASYNQGMICMNWKTKKIERIYDAPVVIQKVYDFAQLSKNRWLLVTQKKIMEWDSRLGILSNKKLPVPDSLGLVYNIRKIIMVDINTCFVTTNRGLFKYDLNTHTINVASESNKSKLTEDLQYDLQNGFFDKGILWIASRNGLFSYNISTKLTTIYRGKGANSNYFFFDITHAANNQIVFAAGNGITIFNKQTKSFKAVNSIANLFNPACETVISINNTIWIGSEAGILNYNLNTHTSARAEQESAMMQIYPSSPFSIIGNDVVFGFRNGYSYFTPGVKNVIIPSDPVIEKVYVNNQPVLLPYPNQKNTKKLILRHSNNSINIAFTAFLYSEPDHINFRYRLMGADPKWQYTEDQRSANYAQLPPGEYTFYLQSGNKNGIWNKHLASFNFIITPPFWAAWWFRSLIILLVAFVLYLLYRYKIQHIKAIESLREGIASDFHDDLGSTLSSISIFSEVAIQKAESDLTAAKSMVGDIGMRARAMINSMNDMVWTIKPENDNLFKLMQRMEEFSYPVAEAKEIQLLFLIDQSLYDIKTDMLRRKNLFLIFKEAFNNAIKYSNSDKIEISFKLTHKKILMMQIIDNGCGFDFNTIKAGNGLLNMKKRTAEVKGKIKITTAIGTGTSINVSCKIA